MKYRHLIYKDKEITNEYLIEKKLRELNFNWLILSEFEDAEIEINIEKNTLIWNYGVWYSGKFIYGIWKNGKFLGGTFENGIWLSGDFKGTFKSGIILDINNDGILNKNDIKFLK